MLVPVTHRIVVRPNDVFSEDPYYAAAKRAGFELPETHFKREQEAVDTGTVVTIGPTAFRDFNTDNPLTVGDTIVYARFGGKRIKEPGSNEELLILNDEDVIAIIRKDA